MRQNLITGGALGWAMLIFLLSSLPASRFEDGRSFADNIPLSDYLAHFGLYFVLGLLVHATLREYLPRRKNLLMIDTVVVCLLYGVSDEFHQSFVPGRSVSGLDLLADVLGAAAAVTFWLAITRYRQRRRGHDADAGRS